MRRFVEQADRGPMPERRLWLAGDRVLPVQDPGEHAAGCHSSGTRYGDGLQSVATIMPTAAKQEWCDAEFAAGVTEIEVTSLVSPKLLPQFSDADDSVRHGLSRPGLIVTALVPNARGAERGIAMGVHKLNYVLSVSESHNRSNVRRSTSESVEDFRRIVALIKAQSAGTRPKLVAGLATSFGCTFEGAVSEDRVRRLAVELAEAGPTSCCWPTRWVSAIRSRCSGCLRRYSAMSDR